MPYRLLLAALAPAFVAACAAVPQKTTPAPPPAPEVRVVTECSFIHPLTFSRKDTKETKQQIIGQADAIAANCSNYKPAQ